mmetsp:Transcript_13213/g.16792  ORF Transcript_13213/g.16792 Transcript_13213/m.16792 type:complete len:217 (-) Transcript_13213:107-757(-)|eukprot:CAMPEP_0170466038 /NCGR_PEP_ID=MMETSP0123-20130129/10161_1 /TAXON_ID=182087 /ORGANISM="Favella ehrenbergii, Strain Fehren 1" /LENGTH=216 /DNA_ID=CAMNT_0010732093 /DNA_START=35 /DNA_END=685 /DNA_ORIENTATION=+
MVEGHRAQIKQQLLAKADEYFAGFETHTTVLEDAARNYVSKQTFNEEGLAVTMSKMRAEGLTMEHLQPWLDDPTSVMEALNNRLTREQLPEHEGHKMWHLKMSMPMIISNRSIITCIYQGETSDGYQAFFHSSQGNEEQATANAEAIGSDVIANNAITMTCYKPCEGGMELKQLLCMDPAGMIPGFIKNAMASRMANGLMLMVDYLKDGTIPAPIL